MTSCDEFEDLIDRTQAGEADAAERERLLEHLDGCLECSELFELVGRVAAEEGAPEPTGHELARMRRAVVDEIATETRRTPVRGARDRSSVRRPVLALAASLALAAIGFALGAGWRTEDLPAAASRGLAGEETLATQMRRVAVRNTTFEEVSDSPYVFANVAAEPTANGQVRLAFDVSRHLDLTVDRNDPLLAEALVQTLVEPGSLGSRLAAIDLAGDRLDPKVRSALLAAMRDDENLGVRLKAQERLVAVGADDRIADAMLEVLGREAAVQMRLVAIDYLTLHSVRPERLERALADHDANGEQALQMRAATYLKQDL